MNRTIFKIFIFTVIIVAVVVLFLKNTGKKTLDPWEAVSGNPALVMEIDHPGLFFDELDKNPSLTAALKKLPFSKKWSEQKQQVEKWLSGDPGLVGKLKNSKTLISIYPDSSISSVFIVALDKPFSIHSLNKTLSSALGNDYALLIKEAEGLEILKIVELVSDRQFYIAAENNLLIAAANEPLLISAVKTAQNGDGAFAGDKLFEKIKKTAGKKVYAKLFYQNHSFKDILAHYVADPFKKTLQYSSALSKYTETDLIVKNNEIILNGMALGDTSSKVYRQFMQQTPQSISVTSMMPFNTKMFVFQGFSDFQKWIKNKNITCGILNNQKFSKWIGHEVALVNTATREKDYYKKSFLLVQLNDKDEAAKLFKQSSVKNVKDTYGNYHIYQLKKGAFSQKLFGELFGAIKENYYTFINDFLVLANDRNELENLLMFYETGKTLDLNENFKKFSKNLTETSNFTLYLKFGDWLPVFTRYFNKELKQQINDHANELKNFESLSVQLSSQPPYLYGNLFLKYNQSVQKEDLALWKVKLEDEIIKKPYPVKDHTTGKYNFIVFDKSNNVYYIRTDGTILWKKEIDGPPESDVKEVDYYKNRKYQYLFNTAEKIYLIDRKGRYVKGYPVKISPAASNGLAVFDYNKRKDYRILLAQADKRIYNYTIKGEKVKGWHAFKMPEIVIRPVQRLIANNKDYILVTDLNKNIKIVNRRGQERIKLKNKFKIADNSIFYVNKTNSKGILLTTDESGKLVYINANGKLNYTSFGKFSKSHFFLYEDFNGDGAKDFIYVDGNKLQVFNRFKKILFSYSFNHPITVKPAFFNIGYKNKVLGIVVTQEKTIYLFDKNGNIIISNGLVGEIPFTVVNSKSNREINLITGSGNILFNYRIK